jgi:hypothetical protein
VLIFIGLDVKEQIKKDRYVEPDDFAKLKKFLSEKPGDDKPTKSAMGNKLMGKLKSTTDAGISQM